MSELTELQRSRLDAILLSTQKKFGVEAATVIAIENKPRTNVEWIELDSPDLNHLLGYGTPRGRMIEIYGPESSGKTSLACYICGQVQKALKETTGGIAGYIDVENALDPEYAKTFGFDVETALLAQPSSGEEALDIAESWVEQDVDVLVIDSVAALVPKSEIEGEMGDASMGVQARLMSKACRKLTALLSRHKTTIIWINQIRMKIGVMYGNPETTTGGNALKFYSSIRLDVRRKEWLEDAARGTYGLLTRVKAIKNKVASPMRVCQIEIQFGKGIQTERAWVDFAITYDVIKKAGAGWMTLPSGDRVQGKDKLVALFRDQPDLYKSIVDTTKERMTLNPQLVVNTSTDK
jgi:recombination protein RecA